MIKIILYLHIWICSLISLYYVCRLFCRVTKRIIIIIIYQDKRSMKIMIRKLFLLLEINIIIRFSYLSSFYFLAHFFLTFLLIFFLLSHSFSSYFLTHFFLTFLLIFFYFLACLLLTFLLVFFLLSHSSYLLAGSLWALTTDHILR